MSLLQETCVAFLALLFALGTALLEDASISKAETVFESASAEYAQGFGGLWERSFILIAAPLVELVANRTGGVRQSHGR